MILNNEFPDVSKFIGSMELRKVCYCLMFIDALYWKYRKTRLGLQCRTPLRSYPLTLIPTHCPLPPSTVPS